MPSGKIHVLSSIIPAMYLSNILQFYEHNSLYPSLCLSCTILGSLLPDIDTPHSFLGRRLLLLSYPINKIFHHRGLFHSLLFYSLIFFFLPLYQPKSIEYLTYGVIITSLYTGIALHIVLDKTITFIKHLIKYNLYKI